MVNRYVRGAVYIVDLGVMSSDHVQGGVRPVVIISNDKNNMYSPTVNVMPFTSQKDYLPIHKAIKLEVLSYTMPEQIQVINKQYLSLFKGILSAEDMEIVDDAIKLQLGLINNMDRDIIRVLKDITTTLNRIEKDKTLQIEENMALEKELKQELNSVNKSLNKYRGMTAIEKFNSKYGVKSDNQPLQTTRQTPYRWTTDSKLSLIKRYDMNPKDESNRLRLMAEFNFKDVKTLQTYVGKFKRELGYAK